MNQALLHVRRSDRFEEEVIGLRVSSLPAAEVTAVEPGKIDEKEKEKEPEEATAGDA